MGLRSANNLSEKEGDPMDEPQLIPVFLPALVTLLARAEQLKGSPLTEQEVLDIRDKGVCMMLRVEHAQALAQRRGYNDLDPEHAWEDWQIARARIADAK
jgi:hypothetical protein